MTREDIITSLKDQARDKDNLAGGDPDSIFTHDAAVLREAADALRAKQSHAKLYDNDAYFDEFKDGVYDLLADDPTWDRANQIIDLFLSAPEVETVPVDDITIDHTKLDRSRWEGCGWCKRFQGKFETKEDRYCRFCGRPLTKEAWAELERRVTHEL